MSRPSDRRDRQVAAALVGIALVGVGAAVAIVCVIRWWLP